MRNLSRTIQSVLTVTAIAFCVSLLDNCSGIKLQRALNHHPTEWPMYGRIPSRTNATPEVVLPPLSLAWEQDISAGIGPGSPLVVDSFLIVGTLRGELCAINAVTGKRIGWVSVGDALQGSPAITGSTAIVASSNVLESLTAFDLTEGKTRWKSNCGDIEVSPLLFNNRVYVANTQGSVFCVDRFTGESVWKFEIAENPRHKGFRSSPAADSNLVVLGGEDGLLYAFDSATGKLRWTYQTGASILAPVALVNNVAYAGTLGGTFLALGAHSGRLLWQFSAGSSIYGGPTLTDETAAIGTTGGILFGLNVRDGSLRWKTDLGGVINSSAVAAGKVLFVGTLKKCLFAISIDDGTVLWQYDVPGRIKTSPSVANGTVYVATDERVIMAFRGTQQ